MTKSIRFFILLAATTFVLVACQKSATAEITPSNSPPSGESLNTETGTRNYDELEIVTLLPPDAIPAIDNPQYLSASDADTEYAPDELILGVAHNGEAKAYSTGLLSSHEIVNDTIGGAKIAVTW